MIYQVEFEINAANCFSDTSALLLAATSPNVNLLAVNINYPSSYSALATSAILSHYGQGQVPISISRSFSNETFIDTRYFERGEYASKIAYQFRCDDCAVRWGHVGEDTWDPVELYRKTLSEAPDGSVTIASVGFLTSLSGLLNSSADSYSELAGPELVAAKVAELVVMGGGYPSGYEFNFRYYDPAATAHVINSWKGSPIVFSGVELGGNVSTGRSLLASGPARDPVSAAYLYYTYNTSRFSWDPLTVLYAMDGPGQLFEFANDGGYNFVYANGSNVWVEDEGVKDQHWLKLKVDNATAASVLDKMMLEAAWSVVTNSSETPTSERASHSAKRATRPRQYTLHQHEEL